MADVITKTGRNLGDPKNRAQNLISERKKRAFIKVLRETGLVMKAAQAVGYTTSSFLRKQYREDPDFAKDWDEALEVAGDLLEQEAFRRAVDGTMEPVYYQGKVAGYKLNYSDSLLQTLLKGALPKKYKDSNVNVDVDGSVKIGVALLPMTSPKLEDWEKESLNTHQGQDIRRMEESNKEIDLQKNEYSEDSMRRG